MEKRMRELVETMRFYQSKDPSAFQAVWESVRKERPLTITSDSSSSRKHTPSATPSKSASPAIASAKLVASVISKASPSIPLKQPTQAQMQSPKVHGRVLGEVEEDNPGQLIREPSHPLPQPSSASAPGPPQNRAAEIYQQTPFGISPQPVCPLFHVVVKF
jgi:hypothetical protein